MDNEIEKVTVGVFGGSGFNKMKGLKIEKNLLIETPWGPPSDQITIGTLEGIRVAFIPRHGEGHIISPSRVPYLANVYAFKSLGVRYVIGSTACGSLVKAIAPKDIVIPDQIFDFTKFRQNSFFGKGLVAHIGFADPFCPGLRRILIQAAKDAGANVHPQGNFITIEGPRFSSRVEHSVFRSWGMQSIGMTTATELALIDEAEMHGGYLALVTDRDCGENEEEVTAEIVEARMAELNVLAQEVVRRAILAIGQTIFDCGCNNRLATAIQTNRNYIDDSQKKILGCIVEKYL